MDPRTFHGSYNQVGGAGGSEGAVEAELAFTSCMSKLIIEDIEATWIGLDEADGNVLCAPCFKTATTLKRYFPSDNPAISTENALAPWISVLITGTVEVAWGQ